jgi:ubiquinone/menaquinone biosynthesis C-methylase UbiE
MSALCRETFGSGTLPREPEPDLIMEGEEQVAAYASAARTDGAMAAGYLFHSARISMVLRGCRTVVDLGCGPATQLAQIAVLNPDVQFTGIDLSQKMLEDARSLIDGLGLRNITLRQDDISCLNSVADHSTDAVISTLALHHLPSERHLRDCFRQTARILKPQGALYLADFTRLKSLKSVIIMAYMYRKYEPHVFLLDYERSLRAAFLFEELKQLATAELPAQARSVGTFLVPFLAIIKTADRELQPEQRQHLQQMRRNLMRRHRRDLDALRLFFRLGGMSGDPFVQWGK